jgi:hypothetical protein
MAGERRRDAAAENAVASKDCDSFQEEFRMPSRNSRSSSA